MAVEMVEERETTGGMGTSSGGGGRVVEGVSVRRGGETVVGVPQPVG